MQIECRLYEVDMLNFKLKHLSLSFMLIAFLLSNFSFNVSANLVQDSPAKMTKIGIGHSSPLQISNPMNKSQSETSWTINKLNQANFQQDLPQGFSPMYAKLQVLLIRQNASTGAIDGAFGLNTIKAISAFQIMQGLKGDGVLDAYTWDALNKKSDMPAFIEYKITAQDLNTNYIRELPLDYAEQAQLKTLSYVRVSEMLAERFQMDELFLKRINPKAKFDQIGEMIVVANPSQKSIRGIHYLVAHKSVKQLYAFDQNNKIIAAFPATIGSEDNPSPSGIHTITSIVRNPYYSYNPKNFIQGKNLKPLSLPPGPNNPVGNVWIGLSKPSFGIHGTPSPSLVSKSASHGCVRLTNWDATILAKNLKTGTQVKFID